MNQRGRIFTPDAPPETEFQHIPHNTYHASTVTGVRNLPGGQQVLIQQFGGPTKLEWAALVIAGADRTMEPAEATRRAFEVLEAVQKFTADIRAKVLKARGDVANGGSTPSPNGSPG